MSSALFIFVELDMQNLPVAYADAGVAALVALIAIVTAKVLHLTLSIIYFGCRLWRYSLGDWPRCLVQ